MDNFHIFNIDFNPPVILNIPKVGSEWVIDEIESDTAVRASAQAGKAIFDKWWV